MLPCSQITEMSLVGIMLLDLGTEMEYTVAGPPCYTAVLQWPFAFFLFLTATVGEGERSGPVTEILHTGPLINKTEP